MFYTDTVIKKNTIWCLIKREYKTINMQIYNENILITRYYFADENTNTTVCG